MTTTLKDIKEKYNLPFNAEDSQPVEASSDAPSTEAVESKEEIITKEEPKLETSSTTEDTGETVSAIEKEAIDMGWDPTYSGDDSINAKEYVRVGKLLEKQAGKFGSKITDLEKTVAVLGDHLKNTQVAAYQKALNDIQTQMQMAEENYDFDSYKALRSQYDSINQEAATVSQEAVTSTTTDVPQANIHPAVQDFEQRNKEWYNMDTPANTAMAAYALSVSANLRRTNPFMDVNDELTQVEGEVKKAFPQRFSYENPKRNEPSRVEGRHPETRTSNFNSIQLTPQQKAIWARLDGKVPGYTMKDYMKDLIKQKEVGG